MNQHDESVKKLYRWLLIGLLFPLVFLDGWLALKVFQYFQPLITIFVLATLLAFILNYPVQFLQKRGITRHQAVLIIFLVTLLVLVTLGVTLLPILLEDLSEIAQLLPQWIDSSNQQLQALHSWVVQQRLPINLSWVVTQLKNSLPNQLQSLGDQVVSLALDTVDSLSEAVLTAVLTFYFLLDGDKISRGVFQRLPSTFGAKVQQSLQQNFQNYLLGQLALAFLVGCSLTIAFLVLKVPFALLLGIGVGVLALIPFGDVFSVVLISLLLASQNLWLGVKVLVVSTVIDQVIDQAIAPRLLGSFTGLRPVWVIVALLVGTKIGGLLGLVIAVPVASVIKSALDGFEVKSTNPSNGTGKPATTQPSTSESGQESPGALVKE